MAITLDSALRFWSAEHPERVMVEYAGDGVTYAQFSAWVGRVASRFVALGLEPGGRVMIVAESSLEWCVAAFAAVRAGGICAGVSPRLTISELAYIRGDYKPGIVVFDEAGGAKLEPDARPHAGLAHVSAIAELREGEALDVHRRLDADAPAIIVTTSGSTSRPKGVMFSHRSMIESNGWQLLSEPLEGPYRRLIVAPMTTAGGIVCFTHALISGGSAYIESKLDGATLLGVVLGKRISMVTGAPIFWQRMAEQPEFESADLSFLKIAHTGGAPVAQPLLERWAAKGVLLRQMYGQTEVGGTATVNPRRFALSHPDKCGGNGIFTEIAIIDADGKHLGPGELGQIIVKGPGFMIGYWNNPEASAKTLVDGWMHTGDIGFLDELGLLKMVDRMKDIIISGGLNIAAAEVERVISEIEGVLEVSVIAVADEKFGETPMAVVHARREIAAAEIIGHCNTHLSSYKVPRYLIFSKEPLPRLAAGKISKPALREMYGGKEKLPARVR